MSGQGPGLWVWLARHRNVLIVLLGFAISLPALRVGFVLDDLVHRALLEGRLSEYRRGALELYEFTSPVYAAGQLVELGIFPWFTDAELRLRFFRPLSSALLALDNLLFGRDPLPAHLHSLAWFVALAGFVGALMRRWFRQPAATLASVIFVIAGVHATPIAWLAGRHSLVAATLGTVALWALARHREEGYRPGAWLAAIFAGSSLLASELGLGVLVFLVFYELGSAASLRQRLRRAAPWLALGVSYLLLYASLGYGAAHSGAYVSPFVAPLEFAWKVAASVPVLLGELFGGAPSVLASMDERAAWALRGYGLLASATCLLVLAYFSEELTADERRQLGWLGAGSVLGLLPLAGGITDGRLLPLAMVGAAALLGNALALLWSASRKRRGLISWLARAALACFALLHLGASPAFRLLTPSLFERLSRSHEQIAKQAELGSCSDAGHLYVLTGADPMLSIYGAASLLFHAPEKAKAERFRVLSMAPQDQELRRTGPDTFELQVLGESRRNNLFESLYRAAPLRAGARLAIQELEVQILAVQSGLFTHARFQLRQGLGTGSCLLVWQGSKLTTIAPPGIGKTLSIPNARGPMGL